MSIFGRWWPRTGSRRTILAAGLVFLGGLVPIAWDVLYGAGARAFTTSPKSLGLMLLGLGLLQGWCRGRRAVRDLLVVVLPLAAIFCTVLMGYGLKDAHGDVVAFAAAAAAAFLGAFALLMSDAAWEYVERPPDPWGAGWVEPLEPDEATALPADPPMLQRERFRPEMVAAGGAPEEVRGMREEGGARVRQGRNPGEA